MKQLKNSLVLRKNDFEIIQSYLRSGPHKHSFDRKDAEEIKLELKKAKLVSADKFPGNVVGLNSKVKVIEDQNDKVIELIVVTPDKADIKERKISVMAPYGDRSHWLPAGLKS
jgi:regulator of nucleoside diphosphate kinase